MMQERFEVELTQGAEDDLTEIFDYLMESRSPEDAGALLEAFLEKIDSLERFPRRGSIPQDLNKLGIREFRQLLLFSYRIIYRIVASKVFIVVIADGRRDMQTLLERRLLGR